MSLVDATRVLLDRVQSSSSTPASLPHAEQALRAALASCERAELIDRALALDPLDNLPIAVKQAMFERRLKLGPRDATVLRQFAEHLWLHGFERDKEVEALRREADMLAAAADAKKSS